MMASMDAEAEMENLFAEDEAEEEQPGTQSLTQEEGMISICILFFATFFFDSYFFRLINWL